MHKPPIPRPIWPPPHPAHGPLEPLLGPLGAQTGWYLPELAHPYYELVKSGRELVFASPLGGLAPLDPGSADAFKADPGE